VATVSSDNVLQSFGVVLHGVLENFVGEVSGDSSLEVSSDRLERLAVVELREEELALLAVPVSEAISLFDVGPIRVEVCLR
jgi:hypothetical protein